MSKALGVTLAVLLAVPLAASAQAQKCSAIIGRTLTVDSKNDEWVSAKLKVKQGDLVLVFAKGTVKVGEFTGRVDANGDKAESWGRLQIKIGTGEIHTAGTQFMRVMEQDGSVKFRVWDTKYRDNDGKFEVVVFAIPTVAIPEPEVVEAD